MNTRTRIIIGLITIICILASGTTYVLNATEWIGPVVSLTNTRFDDGPQHVDPCWLVQAIVPLMLVKSYHKSEVLRTAPFYWEDVDVYEMPGHKPIAHDQHGTVDEGDIACTSTHSQIWVYRPTGNRLGSYCYTPEWTTCRAAGGTE